MTGLMANKVSPMINLAMLAKRYRAELERDYAHLIHPVHRRALQSIIDCHTPQAGELLYHCDHCQLETLRYPSCGHRHCPACQHNANNDWLAAQQKKLLPVDYYLITFTLPYQLRAFVWCHQTWAYQALFQAARQTIDGFFQRDKQLGEYTGLIGVLHTHSRRLDFHPHVHFVVPAGGMDKTRALWQTKAGKYLFNADSLARVFRGKFIALMAQAHFYLPAKTPEEWVASCDYAGQGEGALTYLARYLYRGVISESNILSLSNDQVTFRYKESKTKQDKTITEAASAFLWRVLQHVLPKGFRRARSYGFLHGNAKQTLKRLQLMLKVVLPAVLSRIQKMVCCPKCHDEMDLCFIRRGRHVIFGLTS